MKKILFSLEADLEDLTGRLGFISSTEYNNTFLIRNNVISGCCSPPDYYLFDKNTGQLRHKLGRLIYSSEDRDLPILISIEGSNYDTDEFRNYTSLIIYNVDTDKKFSLKLPDKQINNALKRVKQNYPEYLFEDPVIVENLMYLSYFFERPKKDKNRSKKTITIDIKKYL